MEIFTKDNFNQIGGIQKKRRRPIKLCSSCRERKSKCDMKKPICTSCLVKGIESCKYEESSSYSVKIGSNEVDLLKKENERLLLTIKQLRGQINTVYPTPIPDNSNEIEADKYRLVFSKPNRTMFCGPTSFRIVFQNQLVWDYYMSIKNSLKAQRNDWKLKNRPKPVIFDKVYSESKGLLGDLQRFLPQYSVLLEYLLQFFDGFWYKYLPIVDRDDILQIFKVQFKQPDNDLNIEILTPQNSVQFANIAVIITILKYSVNSEACLAGIVSNKFNDEHDFLLKFATKLLDKAEYLEKASLPSLQAVFMLRIFKKINFKDGDGGDGSNGNILFAICLEMGFTLGLNQNVDILYKGESANYRTVLKNLWKYLLYFDTINSFDLGVPLHISDNNVRKDLLDLDDIFIKTILKKREIMDVFLSPKMSHDDIGSVINEIRNFINQNFKTVFELIMDFENSSNLEDSYKIIHQFVLSISLIGMIQHGCLLLYNELRDSNSRLGTRSHNLAMKYTILMIISTVELTKRIYLSSMELLSTPSTNQIHSFIAGMQNQWFSRAFAFYFFSLLTYVKSLKNQGTRNITDSHIVLRLSELADLYNDVDNIHDDGFTETKTLVSLNIIVSRYTNMRIFLETNGGEREQKKLVTKLHNYSLFILNASLCHYKQLIAQDNDFKSIVRFNEDNLDIVYDSIQDSFPSHLYVAQNFSSVPNLDIFDEIELNGTVENFNQDIYDFLFI